MHHTSVDGKCLAAMAINAAAPFNSKVIETVYNDRRRSPCRIHIFGWYKKPKVALMSSHMRIFWNRPSSQRLVSAASTLATTVSSTSRVTELQNEARLMEIILT